jgi:nucleoid-associated protein YgaU
MHLSRLALSLSAGSLFAIALISCSSPQSPRSVSDLALAEENNQLKADAEKLRQQLAALKNQSPSQSTGSSDQGGDLKAKLQQSDEKLNAAVRSYSQSQDEAAKLRTELDQARGETAALAAQVKDLTAKIESPASLAANPPATALPAVAASSDIESNLATALRSYAMVKEENDQLKSDRDKLAASNTALESQVAALRGAVPVAAQVEGLRNQLRQTQAQEAAYAEENSRLKTQLILNTPAPGALAAPVNQSITATPVQVTPDVPVAAKPTPTPSPAPARVHTIAAGDTLSRISLKYYGTAARWTDILAANRDTLRDEKSLIVGHTLRIP